MSARDASDCQRLIMPEASRLLKTAKTAVVDPAWQSFSIEVYLFVELIYFAFCFAMSRYSRHLEAQRSR